MSITTGRLVITLCALAVVFGALSCSQQEAARFEAPIYYSAEILSQVGDHINGGYEILEGGNIDSAVAEFAKVSDLIQTGVVREYHTACAYARTGNADEAFNWLNQLVDNGFDEPDQITYDQDFASIQEDPRLEAVLKKATDNASALDAVLANGMPEYTESPQAFASEEEFGAWYDEQSQLTRSHGRIWTSAAYRSAMIDLSAKKLAALRTLKGDDPEFDYGLERVREASGLESMYEPWGGITDMVQKEFEGYSGGTPSDDGLAEANYRVGLAVAMQYGEEDPKRPASFVRANTYLANVTEGTEFHAAAQTLTVINKLRASEADETVLGAELVSAVEKFGDNPVARRVLSTQYGPSTVRLTWPIDIDKPDIDNKLVKLSDYRGKAVLIDFWATWCGPCRAELPNLLELYKEYNPQGFEVLSISADFESRLTPADYRQWIGDQGMNWRHIYDGQGWQTQLIKDYFVSSIPAPFLVGKDGSLVAWGEACRGEELKASIEEALGI
ncbi:MAG: TlpA family protein disulfide reductase [bacterium]|nr:TlpA family protein disulfide reductase [bacterium]